MAANLRVKSGIFALLSAMVLAGCAKAPGQSERGSVPKIVSLNLCTDAILVEVADPGQILALSHYSFNPQVSQIDPETVAKFGKSGGSVEEVVALDPDLVLADIFLPPATKAALKELELETEVFDIAQTPEASFEQIRRIAALAGHPDRGEALIVRIEEALAANAAPSDADTISTVLWQPGEIVPGEQALVSLMMRNAGFSSHSAALGMGQADFLPLEDVVAHPPQLLLVAGNSRGQQHPALAKLDDLRTASLDQSLLYCGGPTIIRAAERLSQIRREIS